jgi:hypothetical protein
MWNQTTMILSPLAAFVTDDESMNSTFSGDLFAEDEDDEYEMLMQVANDVVGLVSENGGDYVVINHISETSSDYSRLNTTKTTTNGSSKK